MQFSNGQKAAAGVILLVIAVVVAMVSWSGDRDDLAKELEQEPQITVYFNDTRAKRTMGLEEYLQGVVAGEMFPDWPIEAYAAQAIFARASPWRLLLKEDCRTNTEQIFPPILKKLRLTTQMRSHRKSARRWR